MPGYTFVARDAAGAVRTGFREAPDEKVLARGLQEEGLTVGEIKLVKKSKPKLGAGIPGFGRIKLVDLAIFCRQFSTMIDAGVSIVRCLSVLGEQTQNPRLRAIIQDVVSEVEQGQTLTQAFERHPKVFSRLFLGLIHAGEVGGVLEENLQRLAHFLEKDVELRRKIKSAMMYPTIVVIFALAVIIILVTFIFPKFMQVFKDLEVTDFPQLTVMLMSFSNFLTQKWWLCIIGVILFVVAFRMFTRTRFGRRLWDKTKLKMPVVGKINHKIVLARFSRTLGTLLNSGVPILQSLETVAGTVANDVISEAVMEARARIREGDRIGAPLKKSGLFPPMVVHMVSIGEESGSLDTMLNKIADFYESEVDAAVAGLTSIIEPLLIVFLGVAVGTIILSVLLPMVKLIQGLMNQNN